MIKETEIKLGIGMDQIKFGFSTAKIEDILGEPDLIDKYEHEDGERTITYFYYEFGIDLNFDSEDNYKLSAISIVNPEFHYKNVIKVGISRDEALDQAENIGLSEPEDVAVATEEFPTHSLLAFEKENLNLWFDEGKVSEIEFGPFWKDENSYIWPE